MRNEPNNRVLFSNAYETFKNICKEEKLILTEEFEINLIKLLPTFFNYQEEEVSIKPQIIISDNLNYYLKSIPSKSKINIASGSLSGDLLKRQIKSILPFCNISWIIFIDIDFLNNSYEIGILRAHTKVDGFDIEDQLFIEENDETSENSLIFVKVLNRYEMQIKGIKITDIIIDFRFFGYEQSLDNNIELITKDFLEKVTNKEINTFGITKMFQRLVEYSHGSIVILLDEKCSKLPANLFMDGIWFKEPIDIFGYYKNLVLSIHADEAINANEKYFTALGLFYQMANIDGAIILNNNGHILGYNCFIKTMDNDETENIAGGARKRAFYAIKNNNEDIVKGILFISQDGETIYERINLDE